MAPDRWQRLWHITLPGIMGVTILLLILRLGAILTVGFEQILLQRNAVGPAAGEVLDTLRLLQGHRRRAVGHHRRGRPHQGHRRHGAGHQRQQDGARSARRGCTRDERRAGGSVRAAQANRPPWMEQPSRCSQRVGKVIVLALVVVVVVIYPFVSVVATSLASEQDVIKNGGLVIWPEHPTLDAYRRSSPAASSRAP